MEESGGRLKMLNSSAYAITGMGYLGRPLAERLFESGDNVVALKRLLTSDDVNLPVELDIADLNDADVFKANFWQQNWVGKTVWFWLIPPSALADYAEKVAQWGKLAKKLGAKHLIFASSISVYGNADRMCDENSAVQPQSEAAKVISEAEQKLQVSGVENIDILRLGGLYCGERHPLNSLLRKNHIAGAFQPVNVLHRSLAVNALAQAAIRPNGMRIRNIVEPSHPVKHDFYRAEAQKLGLPEADFDMSDTTGGKTVNTLFNDLI